MILASHKPALNRSEDRSNTRGMWRTPTGQPSSWLTQEILCARPTLPDCSEALLSGLRESPELATEMPPVMRRGGGHGGGETTETRRPGVDAGFPGNW